MKNFQSHKFYNFLIQADCCSGKCFEAIENFVSFFFGLSFFKHWAVYQVRIIIRNNITKLIDSQTDFMFFFSRKRRDKLVSPLRPPVIIIGLFDWQIR